MVAPSSGAAHEHMRWDRDGFVKILEENIQQGAKKNFKTKSTDAYSTFGTPFDYQSVMHHVVLKMAKTKVFSKYLQIFTAMGPRTSKSYRERAVIISNVFSEKAFSAQGDQKTLSQTFWLAGLQKFFQICGTFLDFYFGFLLAFAYGAQHCFTQKVCVLHALYHQMHRLFVKSTNFVKHCKNCECCPRHSLFKGHNVNVNIAVLNCQKCNQCLKCQVLGHKSLGLLFEDLAGLAECFIF